MTPTELRAFAEDCDAQAMHIGCLHTPPRAASAIRALAKKHRLRVVMLGGRQELPPLSVFCQSYTGGHNHRVLANALRWLADREGGAT